MGLVYSAELAAFWETIWTYCGVRPATPYESVLQGEAMPFYKWLKGARLNYVEHIFLRANRSHPAIVFQQEGKEIQVIDWFELERKTASLAAFFKALGVGPGDCVAGYLANAPEATIAFLTTAALGAVWSCCSPDFGVGSVVERLSQIKPKILVASDGYTYGDKAFHRRETLAHILR